MNPHTRVSAPLALSKGHRFLAMNAQTGEADGRARTRTPDKGCALQASREQLDLGVRKNRPHPFGVSGATRARGSAPTATITRRHPTANNVRPARKLRMIEPKPRSLWGPIRLLTERRAESCSISRTIAAAGSSRIPTPPRSSTKTPFRERPVTEHLARCRASPPRSPLWTDSGPSGLAAGTALDAPQRSFLSPSRSEPRKSGVAKPRSGEHRQEFLV